MTKTSIQTSADTFKQAGCITQGQLDKLQKNISSKDDHKKVAELQTAIFKKTVKVLSVCAAVALLLPTAALASGLSEGLPRCRRNGGTNGSAPPAGCKAKTPEPCLQTDAKLCIVVGK